MKSRVSFVKLPRREGNKQVVFEAVIRAMRLVEYEKYIRGRRIAVKPNLVSDQLVPGQNTSPWVLEAVISELVEKFPEKSFFIIESDTNTSKVENAIRLWKIDEICDRYGVPFLNLSEDVQVEYRFDGVSFLKKIKLPRCLAKFDSFIDVPVIKTHAMSGITLALKNWWGLINERQRHHLHLWLPETLRDLHAYLSPKGLRPCFAVLDGTIWREGLLGQGFLGLMA